VLTNYLTISQYGTITLDIRKSVFIGHIKNVTTEDDATEFIEGIKKKYWDATHNCSAYIIGENDEIQKASDDGEPSGTAGKPILEVIKRNNLKDTVIVVTRYFGGIKLGSGGLIRAYGQTANEVIQSTGIVERALHTIISFTVDYTWLGKIENELNNRSYIIKDIDYLDKVTIYALAKVGFEEQLEQLIINLTGGQAAITRGSQLYIDTQI